MPLDFAKSARSTIGIEWELQLIDKDSNDLRQAAEHMVLMLAYLLQYARDSWALERAEQLVRRELNRGWRVDQIKLMLP